MKREEGERGGGEKERVEERGGGESGGDLGVRE